MSADLRLKSFIDRVLRLKEEQDGLAKDIREIYAEAKGEGFNKTAMGDLVAHLRKVEKHGSEAVAAGESDFDLYRNAYERASGTGVATHTHDAEQFDPETGEIHGYDSGQRVGRQDGEQRGSAPVQGAIGRGESADGSAQGHRSGVHHSDPRDSGTVRQPGNVSGGDEGGRSRHVVGEARHEITPSDGGAFVAVKGKARLANAESVEPLPSDSHLSHLPSPPATEQADEGAPPPSSASDIPEDVPAFILKDRKPLRPYCQHPDDLTQCGGYGQKHCGPCRKAMADREAA